MRVLIVFLSLTASVPAYADWYYYVMKVECGKTDLRIIDYSAYNEEGDARRTEPGAIDVDTLSTWRSVGEKGNELNVPDKPLPYVKVCSIPTGTYKVILTNAGGGYSAPYPVVNVIEISNSKKPKSLFHNLELSRGVNNRYEIVFSKEHPTGLIIDE